jgi:hypothetical protein
MAMLGRGQTRAIGHEKRYSFFLRALEDERNSFCTLTAKETYEGGRQWESGSDVLQQRRERLPAALWLRKQLRRWQCR